MPARPKPNVIFVLTDDQGYADLGCTGNPWIQTPNIDRFHGESVRFTDFHVQPLCTPTRGALMSAHRPIRNGAWATCWGRSILRRSEYTLANAFADSGYATGMFGKWHLGDNYPYRPQDRGFQQVVAHKGGGVGQTPDFWGNNYFDDTYFANGTPTTYEGYCTDVWFDQALQWIETSRDRPFFAYIATNAPHSPYLVAKRYRKLYEDNPEIPNPAFYGMITNIDDNFGRLDAKLEEWGIRDNTILIFMTDNGSSGGARLDRQAFCTSGYNAGMRGMKGSYYDGGHRVPCFIRWPDAGIQGGRDVGEMVLDIDFMPTLIDLCGLTPADHAPFDGISAAKPLREVGATMPDRVHFLQIRQGTEPPEQWANAVITPRWRLVFGKDLYDIRVDPGQRHDLAADHPKVVEELRAAHRDWWHDVSRHFDQLCPIVLGNDAENPTTLSAMDVMGDVAWNQQHIVAAKTSTGRWAVEVEKLGSYLISLRRWPPERDLPLAAAITEEESMFLAPYNAPYVPPVAVNPTLARVVLFGEAHTIPVDPTSPEVRFEITVEQTGTTELEAWFLDGGDGACGAYYVVVERL